MKHLPALLVGLTLFTAAPAPAFFSARVLDKNLTEAVKIEVRGEAPVGVVFMKSVLPKKKTGYFLARFEKGVLKSLKPISAASFRQFTRAFFNFYDDPTRRHPAQADCQGTIAVNVRQRDKLLLDDKICLGSSAKDRARFAHWYRAITTIP